MWTKDEAISLCKILEDISPDYGYHVALTGGCLYKEGLRKDTDIVFYSIRQTYGKRKELENALELIGIKIVSRHGWMNKAVLKNKRIDLFFPETYKTTEEEYYDYKSEEESPKLEEVPL